MKDKNFFEDLSRQYNVQSTQELPETPKRKPSGDSGYGDDDICEIPEQPDENDTKNCEDEEHDDDEEYDDDPNDNERDIPAGPSNSFSPEGVYSWDSQPAEMQWLFKQLTTAYGDVDEHAYNCTVYAYFYEDKAIYYGSTCGMDARYEQTSKLWLDKTRTQAKKSTKNIPSIDVLTTWPEGKANLMIALELESLLIMSSSLLQILFFNV
uniref:Uncharacterized protein n=1 Tax=Panagrolaimus superbus TaxID=310955 RepID=A0A914YYY9_9BILA